MEFVREIMCFNVREKKLPLYRKQLLSISLLIGNWRIVE
jgi:hypothetical protein